MQERRAFYVIFAIAATLIIPAAVTLRTVVHPVILQATSNNPTPLGYTWSPAIVYHPDRRAGLVVFSAPRFAVFKICVLANPRGANAAGFRARPALWQRF